MLNHPLLVFAVAASGLAQTASPGSQAVDVATPRLLDPATLPADEQVTAPLAPPAAQAGPAERSAPASGFTIDTPIGALIADAGAKAVLDRDLPGLSDDANLARFEGMSLREFQPLTGGQLDEALLAKVGSDLAAIVPGQGTGRKPAPRRIVEGR